MTPGDGPEVGVGVWLDLDSWPYRISEEIGPWRVSRCCHAFAKGAEDGIVCRKCYDYVPVESDTPARLDADWSPGDGPITMAIGEDGRLGQVIDRTWDVPNEGTGP